MLEILLDQEDAHLLALTWHISKNGYVRRSVWCEGKVRSELLHRVITDAPAGMVVDHINGNRLDNRRCNLRVCSPADNAKNRGPASHNTTGFKGVFYDARANKFVAELCGDSVRHCLGAFATAEEAAEAYNAAALKYHGEFARLN